VLVNSVIETLFGYGRAEQRSKVLLPERYRKKRSAQRNASFADPKVRPMGMGTDLYGSGPRQGRGSRDA
jgi:hypothetical protein